MSEGAVRETQRAGLGPPPPERDDSEVLRSLAEHTHSSLAVYELDGRVVYVNPATERLFGKSLAELRGRRLFEDLFPAAIGNAFHRAFARVAEGGPPETFDHYYPPFKQWFSNQVARVGDRVHVVAREVTTEVRVRRRLELLTRVSAVVADDGLELGAAMDRFSHEVAQSLDADCLIGRVEAEGATLRLLGRSGRGIDVTLMLSGATTRKLGARLAAAVQRREVTRLAGAELAGLGFELEDPAIRQSFGAYRPGALIAVPILLADETAGLLLALRREAEPPLDEEDSRLAAEVAPHLGLYLAHANRRSEAVTLRDRLSALADALPVLVSFVDRDERYRYVNANYERWMGKPREFFLGRTMREIAPSAEAYAYVAGHVKEALSGQPVRFRSRFAVSLLGERDLDVQYVPVRDEEGNIAGIAVLALDVTAEVRVQELERARRETERRGARRLETLIAAAGELAATSQVGEIAEVLVDQAIALFDASTAALYVVSPDGDDLLLADQRGFMAATAAAFTRTPLARPGPLADCIRSGQPVWLDSRADYAARYPEEEAAHRSTGAAPISIGICPVIIEGKVVGCCAFTYGADHHLTAEDKSALEVLSSHAAEALRRARLYGAIRYENETRAAMIRASPAAIVVTDERGVVELWNPAAERVFGWSEVEVMGKVVPIGGTRHDELLRMIQAVHGGAVVNGAAVRRQRKNGEWFDAELYAAPVTSGDGRVRHLSMFVDVAQRQRLEQGQKVVAEATAVLSRSLEIAPSLLEVVRLAAAELADWCCIDLLDGDRLRRVAVSREPPGGALPLPRPLAAEPPERGVSLAISRGEPELHTDLTDEALQRIARDREQLRALRALASKSLLSVPLKTGQGVLGALTLGSTVRNFDGIDLVIAQELASHIVSALENARLFDEAKKARAEAEAASRAKDEFLAMLGHELRNPLAPMRTALELMRLRAPQHSLKERGVIERQVAHLSRLVDDLLDVSRITRGKIELKKERTLVAEVVAKALEQTSSLFEQKNHRLTVEVGEQLAVVADATRLSQVLSNLLSNSARYTPAEGHVALTARLDGERIVLEVRDDGAGISPEMLPRVFDSFVQAPQTSARTEGGLGLGLTIVKSLVELHGGTVSVKSPGPGQGTTVIVSLPAAAPLEGAVGAATGAAPKRSPTSRRVLIVDDNEDAAVTLSEVLETAGHAARVAYDGPSALELATAQWPDVAVLDIGLPVMDGFELAERLRALAQGRPLKLIALTGYGQASHKRRAMEAGFAVHFSKPVDLDALIARVTER